MSRIHGPDSFGRDAILWLGCDLHLKLMLGDAWTRLRGRKIKITISRPETVLQKTDLKYYPRIIYMIHCVVAKQSAMKALSSCPSLLMISFVQAILEMLHTFKVKEHIGLVVFEHLSNKLDVHILNVDFLELD